MSPQAQKGTANKTLGKRASKNRDRSRRASFESLSLEEINADLSRLEAEMKERKPQRASLKRKILKKRLTDLKRLERGWEKVKRRIIFEAEQKLKEEEEDIAQKRAMNKMETEEISIFNEWLNPLAAALIGLPIEDQMDEEPVFFAVG